MGYAPCRRPPRRAWYTSGVLVGGVGRAGDGLRRGGRGGAAGEQGGGGSAGRGRGRRRCWISRRRRRCSGILPAERRGAKQLVQIKVTECRRRRRLSLQLQFPLPPYRAVLSINPFIQYVYRPELGGPIIFLQLCQNLQGFQSEGNNSDCPSTHPYHVRVDAVPEIMIGGAAY